MENPSSTKIPSFVVWILVTLIMAWIVVVVTCSQFHMAPTFDEQNHVTRGIAILHTGDFRLCFHHPPLANILEGLPVAWQQNGFSTHMASWQPNNPKSLSIWDASHTTIWSHPRQGVHIIHLARIPVLIFTLLLALLVFIWSRELFGVRGGLFSLALFALDPTILAHSGLATTDMAAACTIVLAAYLLRRYIIKPSLATLLLAGLGVGLAMASKFSALILLPIIAVLLLIFALAAPRISVSLSEHWVPFPWWKRVGHAIGVGLAMLFIAGIVVWGTYGFKVEALGSKPGQPVAATATSKERIPVPAMQYLRGIKAVSQEADGHRSFLLGQTDTTGHGWWYYFPVALATKTPIPELIFLLVPLFVLIIPRTRRMISLRRREIVFLLLPVGVYTLAALGLLGISLNLGIRHILPIYPFLFILAGSWMMLRISSQLYRPALGAIFVVQLASVVLAYPDFISYFNEISIAKQDGYHILVDSNYDWGQDLGQLAKLQRQDNLTPLYLSYFGTTPPEAYGLQYKPLPGFGLMSNVPKPDIRHFHGFIALSVTDLMGGKAYTGTSYQQFQSIKPYAVAGKTINVYWIP